MDDSKARTAYHESAHSVVALMQGYRVKVLRIKRELHGQEWQKWAGAAEIEIARAPRTAQCNVAVAGFLAEARWHATESFADAIFHEQSPMDSFIAQLRDWTRRRLQVDVPLLRGNCAFDENVVVFDGDLGVLKPNDTPLDEAVVASARTYVRRVLNTQEIWSAVIALAQRLLEEPPSLWQYGEAVELGEYDVRSLVERFTEVAAPQGNL